MYLDLLEDLEVKDINKMLLKNDKDTQLSSVGKLFMKKYQKKKSIMRRNLIL